LANGENVLSHDYSANDHEARVQLIAGTLGGPPGRFPYAVTFKEQQAARSPSDEREAPMGVIKESQWFRWFILFRASPVGIDFALCGAAAESTLYGRDDEPGRITDCRSHAENEQR
jgi:hypothetical protein